METVINSFYHIKDKSCLCLLNNLFWGDLSFLSEELSFEVNLLSLNMVREIGDIYAEAAVKNGSVCKSVDLFVKSFLEPCNWNNFVLNSRKAALDQYLLYMFSKSMTSLLYSSSVNGFQNRIKSLLGILCDSSFEEDSKGIVQCLISLLDVDKKSHATIQVSTCPNLIPCSAIPLKDLVSCLLFELHSCWQHLRKRFFYLGGINLNLFLCLWKLLEEKNYLQNTSRNFSGNICSEFFSLSSKLDPLTFRMYVDVFAQNISSSLKSLGLNPSYNLELEDIVLKSLSDGFLNSIPISPGKNDFCFISEKATSTTVYIHPKLDTVTKKVLLIVFYLLTEFHSEEKLLKAFLKISDFIQIKTGRSELFSDWIIKHFSDNDDLLFGMIFVNLKIYLKLKGLKCSQKEAICQVLNPHALFCSFLRSTGNDHNLLLSYLLSDETCCLEYLMAYLKLLLSESGSFVDTISNNTASSVNRSTSVMHSIAHCLVSSNACEMRESAEMGIDTLEPVVDSISSLHDVATSTESETSKSLKTYSKNRSDCNPLVSYSSTSSSEDELEVLDKNIVRGTDIVSCHSVVKVLENLRRSIQRLVDLKEFPFNASPLISLLKACEYEAKKY